MKQYAQKPASISHVIEAKPRASHQGTMKEMLEAWRSHPIQKREAIPVIGRQDYSVLQREINPDVEESLKQPLVQLRESEACWFLSVLYGIHRAGWIRDLFTDTIAVEFDPIEKCYYCRKGTQNIKVVFKKAKEGMLGRPLWQQILEAFIDADMDEEIEKARTKKEAKKEEKNKWAGILNDENSFQKRIKISSGTGGITPKVQKDVMNKLLGTFSDGWKVEEMIMRGINGASTIEGLRDIRKKYLVSSEKGELQVLKLITVEKTGHAMGVKSAEFTSWGTDVTISNLCVFNQFYGNSQEYKAIKPSMVSVSASKKKGVKDWAASPEGDLKNINYYKLSRPSPQSKKKSLTDISLVSSAEPKSVLPTDFQTLAPTIPMYPAMPYIPFGQQTTSINPYFPLQGNPQRVAGYYPLVQAGTQSLVSQNPAYPTMSAFGPALMASQKPEAEDSPEFFTKTSMSPFFSPSADPRLTIINPKPRPRIVQAPNPSVKMNTPRMSRWENLQITTDRRSTFARVGSQIAQTPRFSVRPEIENPYASLMPGLNLPVNPITISCPTGGRAMEEVKKGKKKVKEVKKRK